MLVHLHGSTLDPFPEVVVARARQPTTPLSRRHGTDTAAPVVASGFVAFRGDPARMKRWAGARCPGPLLLRWAGTELPDLVLTLGDPGRQGCQRHLDLLTGER